MAKPGRAGLGLWDRLVLLLAWGVTCGLVYLLGFYVGKGMQERPLGPEDRLVRLPVTSTPPPEGQRPKADSELTFYDTLTGSERGTPHRPRDTAPPAPAPTPAAPSTSAQPVAVAAPTPRPRRSTPHARGAPVEALDRNLTCHHEPAHFAPPTDISLNRLMFSVIAVSVGSRSMLDAPKKPATPSVRSST